MVDTAAREILRLRLATQRIDPLETADVASTVRHLVAVQAQDFANGLWAIGLRSKGSTRSSVLDALERAEIVRTLPMRGTLHFIAAEDLRWMLALTAERTLQSASTRMRGLGLDQATLDRAQQITLAALTGGNSLSRDEFMKLLGSNAIAPDGQRGYHIIFYLCQLALVCWGPPRGTQQALVLVDEWIAPNPNPNPNPSLSHEAALEAFALRYFASHGPATERDFAWWTKLTLRDVRAAIAGLGSRLTTLTHDGTDYLIATDALETVGTSAIGTTVQALPGFDEYLLGYEDRSLALESEHFARIVPGNNGMFLPMIVSRGEIIGTWRRTSKKLGIEPDYFTEATPARLSSFARAAKRYERFAAG